ncbi:MAG TPA: N-acetylmuramoyl-L-alanine amidase [Candidatus Polarisedimenticolia bacterium]|nr:N-acetylmuramoyl-L-alanine amidase [Candidatus Polarisedimenticolia bacterium]
MRPHPGPARARFMITLAVLCGLLALPSARAASGTGRSQDDPKPARRLDPPSPPADAAALAAGERVILRSGRDLMLEVRMRPQETYASLGQRYLVDLRELAKLRAQNGETPPRPGSPVVIPYESLSGDYKVKVIRDLFPRDGPRDGAWVHIYGSGRLVESRESLRQVALWLTGDAENARSLAERNGLTESEPDPGREILVPGDLLLPPFGRLAGVKTLEPLPGGGQEEAEDDFSEAAPDSESEAEPPAPEGTAEVPMAEGADRLSYGHDREGPCAFYRLKRGEALYSAVVMRYTGRIDAQDVNELALRLARRSGVKDVTDIPIGFKITIPLEELLPEYLPRDDPRRQAWERSQAEVSRYTNEARSRNLKGIAVILDAGHGGRDQGAAHNGLWEHDYVYDILCRIKARLETGTGARVLATIKDLKEGYAIHETSRLTRSRAEVLLTDPPFALQQAVASVNLRWYLSNAYLRRLETEGQDPLKVVFTSLHADARHPSLGGAMVYVPGEGYRRGRYGHGGPVYVKHREVREEPYVSFTRAERERSEGLSRQFAAALVTSFRHHGVAVHPYGPIRERIIRRGRSWVPAVLRCNEVPVEVLVEVSNLSNPADSRLLADPAYRQKVAEAYVDALQAYYGGPSPRPRSASAGGH